MICIPIWAAVLLLAGIASFSACIGLLCAGLLAAKISSGKKNAEMGPLWRCTDEERGAQHESL